MKSKKASGHDSISNGMINASLPSSSSFLVTLFNKILQTQICPEEWSRGITSPVPKFKEIENPGNYCSITINSCLSKLFNLLILCGLKVYDIVWCEALFKELLGYGVSTNFVSFFEKFVWKNQVGCTPTYRCNRVFPSNAGLTTRVPLFNLFINNIREIFDVHLCHPVILGNIKLSNPLYAGDLKSNIWN